MHYKQKVASQPRALQADEARSGGRKPNKESAKPEVCIPGGKRAKRLVRRLGKRKL